MAAALRRLEALPPAIPLAVIVVVAAAVTIDYATGLANYFVMPDELGYIKQASEIADRLFILTPGDPWFNSWAQLQPVLMAPFYGILETPRAFDFMHAMNAFVMASAAIPAYLLARPLVPARIWAYAAAALSTAIPWLAMAGSAMTEVSAYPVFTWAVFGMHRAIARPSPGRDVVAVVLLGIAFFSRTQFAVLGPVFLAAIVGHELSYGLRGDPSGTWPERVVRALRRSVVAHPAAVLAAAAGLAGAIALGLDSLLGSYAGVGGGTLLPEGTLAAGREVMAYIVVAIGILPLAVSAAWAGVTLARPESPERHAFAVLLVLVVAVMTVMAGSFTVQYTTGINDRYLFYLAPLLFAGLVAGLTTGRRIAVPLGVIGVLVAWLVFASDFARPGASLVSPSATFHLVLDGRAYDVGRLVGNPELSMATMLGGFALVGTLALAAALRFLPRAPVAAVAVAAVLVYGVLETGYVLDKIGATQEGVGQEFLDNRPWADQALPDGTRAVAVVGALEDFATTVGVYWDLLFWNRQVDRVAIREGDPIYDQPFHTRFTFDPETGGLDGLDHRGYLVRADGDVRFGVRGAQTIDARNLLLLETAPRPYEAAWAVLDAGPRGRVPAGESTRIRVYGDGEPGVRPVTVVLLPTFDAERAYRYELSGNGVSESGTVELEQRLEVPLRLRVPAEGYAELELRVLGRRLDTEERRPGLRVGGVVLPPGG